MNLADITTKCYILALIIRDDGERLLLGDGAYEFKDSQQHFIANTYANDVVELQGTDGQMLAGQVRRTATQTFAGYIGDATFSKQAVESARRDFLMFFRKKHYYTAVYVFSDGTAIQRDRGYIVNAPSVPELYQRYPEWSVGLNFEDPNYYEYAEDDLGQEIAAHKVELELSTAMSGGLIWDGDGAVSDDLSYVGTEIPGEGKNFQLADTGTATLKSAELLGDATQTTYSGKNLLPMKNTTRTINGVTFTPRADGSIALSGTASAQTNYPINVDSANISRDVQLSAGTYTVSWGSTPSSSGMFVQAYYTVDGGSGQYSTGTFTVSGTQATLGAYIRVNNGINTNGTVIYPMLESGSTATAYEPYVGGTASPNPDYPQAVNTVTGEQTVKIEGKNLFDVNRTLGAPSNTDYAGTTKRFFNFSEYIIGLSNNNYYVPTNITAYSLTNGVLTIQSSSPGYGAAFPISAVPNTTYRLSFDATNASNSVVGVGFYKSDGTYTQTQILNNNNPTFNTPADCAFFTIVFRPNANQTCSYSNIQLEFGSTATTYEPYQGQQTKTVNLGKNLFDINSLNSTNVVVSDGVATASAAKFNTDFGVNTSGISLSSIPEQITISVSGYTDGNSSTTHNGGLLVVIEYTDSTRQQLTFYNDETTETRKNITSNADKTISKIYITYGNSGANIWHISKFMVEKGSQATTYAPFLITKNLCSGTSIPVSTQVYFHFDKNIITAGAYTLSTVLNEATSNNTVSLLIDGAATNIGTFAGSAGSVVKTTFTLTDDQVANMRNSTTSLIRLYKSGANFTNPTWAQLELGSTATPYEPYGTPYELVKIGDYQDYIFNDNGTWKIHKAVGKVVLDGTETWNGYVYGGIFRGQYNVADIKDINANAEFVGMSDYFYADEGVLASTTIRVGMFCQYQHTTGVYFAAPSSVTTMNEWKSWLGSHKPTVYYALETPTDTEITNVELVGQLERLRHAHTYADTTNFSVTATSPNLPAFLKVVAFGDDAIPQGGYVWEDGGAGGATTITVDGVDNAQPIWTVVGPATNPSLTNITTGESIQWTGVVPNGQTLVVNMADMTASLSGANVFEFISGSWITLQAGNNRVSYSATAATGIATLEWNGVVG